MLKIQFEDKRKPAMWLVDSVLKLGSDPSCDIVVDESMVAPFHAELVIQQGEILLKNVSGNRSVFINEIPVVNEQVLDAWDTIRLGSSELEIIDPLKERSGERGHKPEQATIVRPAVSPWMLKGGSTPLDGQYFSLADGNIIGREKNADITVPLSFVSRQHAKIALRKDKLYIEDMNSSNGTYVNGDRVISCELRNGDELRFDEFIFNVIGPVTKIDSKPRTVVRDKKTSKKKPSVQAKANTTPKNLNQNEKVFLHGISADVQGKIYEITNAENHISRMLGHHLSTSEKSVSARHVYLMGTDLGWEIKNNGASDGLLVNGKMQSRAVLQDGDEIIVGGTLLKFQSVGEQPLNYKTQHQQKKNMTGLVVSGVIVTLLLAGLYFSGIFTG
ncbi:FHA domain-containing protein [Aliikangiella sp. IMCC44359]|uniref:FHA domain-containing protein n=1 Tax=Aliikangiella sp. IMCC44359 TaxID=3459125 RepID=UPI00403AA892